MSDRDEQAPRRAWGTPLEDAQPLPEPIPLPAPVPLPEPIPLPAMDPLPVGEPAVVPADEAAVVADTATARDVSTVEPAAVSPQPVVSQPNPAASPVPVSPPKPARMAPVNPRTGEPRRPWAIWAVAVCQTLAVACLGVSLGLAYFVAVDHFAQASWLMAAFDPQGAGERVLLAVGITAAALIAAIGCVIAGYYAWAGYRWSRVAALIAWLVSSLALLLNVYALPAIVLTAAAAVLVWLPPAGRFFAAWQARRHPVVHFSPPFEHVFYGPLPRYRNG